ncbi:MAG TPA: hypothetical protein VGJ82_09430 [Thermoanaerobaculia bacterium]|jgi:hypothetical protein
MTTFIHHALEDMRGGRSTWRVVVTVTLPSFAIAFGAALIEFAH